ncbi:Glutamine transport system permease protein GlnP [compost metagenome]
MNNIDFFFVFGAWPRLLEGLIITVKLTLWANAIGIVGGFLLSLVRTSPSWILSSVAKLYIEIFRCTPAMVQIVWFFFCIPMLFDVFWDPVLTGALILGLNLMAFNAEAFRASMQGIPIAQKDAGVALGLGPWVWVTRVVLPQAMRSAAPVLMTNAIGTFQQSSLVALVGVQDLMYQGKMLSVESYRPIETFTFLVVFYLAVSIPLGRLASYLEYRTERALRQ